jgi:short-subunit dehydrogenase
MGVDGVKFTLVCPSYVDTGMFEGAKPPLMTKMLKPKDIVDIAYEAFKQDKYIVNEPWLVKLTPALKGILPYQAFDLVSGILGVTKSMHKWRDLRH